MSETETAATAFSHGSDDDCACCAWCLWMWACCPIDGCQHPDEQN